MDGTERRPGEADESRRTNVVAVLAIIAAILSIPFAFIPLAFAITIPLALLAIGLGLVGRRRALRPTLRGRGRDLSGIACGVGGFGLLVGLLSAVAAWNATRFL